MIFHTFLMFLWMATLVPLSSGLKIILMYAPCDDSLIDLLHVIHVNTRKHIMHQETQHDFELSFKKTASYHSRHDLSNACIWVLEDTIGVVAISDSTTDVWSGIDQSADLYNLPHLVIPQPCSCHRTRSEPLPKSHLLEVAIFQYLKQDFLKDVFMLHDEDHTTGAFLTSLLSWHSVRVSHLRVTDRPGFLRRMERYFEVWNLMDLSDSGRLLVYLGNGTNADELLKKLLESNMHNKRTKVLVADSVEKWQQRLHQVRAYEVDLIIVTNGRVHLDDCPTAIEFLPIGNHSLRTATGCSNLSAEYRMLGQSVISDIHNGLSRCCSRQREEEYTFWRSFPFENGTQRLKPVALWSKSLNLFRMSSIDLEMITLRIAVLPYNPYMIVKSEGGEVTLENCVFKEIISFVSERLNFRYKLVTPPDEEWGTKLGNNQWTGAIGMIIRGEADMIPYLTMTPSRQEAVDFSKPLGYVTYKILIPFPREPPRAFIFLRPYTKEVWFSLMFAALLVSFALWKIHTWSSNFYTSPKRAKSLMSFSNCFWIIYGATLQQGGTFLPVTNSARLVLSSWWLGVMVIMATYSANLIAFLAFPEMKWVLKKLEDLANHKTLHLSIKTSCPVLEDFKESNITLYQKIREIYLSNPRRSLQIQDKHLPIADMVAEGKTVFIDDANFLNRLIDQDYREKGRCRITVAPEEFSRMDLALGMRRGSSMIALVNEEIQQMREHGVLRFWKKKYSPSRGECFEVATTIKGQAKVSLQDLQGPFYLLALGSTIALAFLTVEFCLRVLKARHSRYLKRKLYRKKLHISLW